MRRIKVLLLSVVLMMGGCKTLHHVTEIVAVGAVVVGAAVLNHHYHGHHFRGHHGHHGH